MCPEGDGVRRGGRLSGGWFPSLSVSERPYPDNKDPRVAIFFIIIFFILLYLFLYFLFE